MKFQNEIKKGIFLKRYKRFFADIEVDGRLEVAHVPNTGSLKGCIEPGSECLVTYKNDPNRKLKYTLELIKTPSSWVGVNTSHPNFLVYELWSKKIVPHWKHFDNAQREIKISKETRLDLALWSSAHNFATQKGRLVEIKPPVHFIEVKNVTLIKNNTAQFPDSETTRGQKHLLELIALKDRGFSCELVFVVQRQDVSHFSPADDIDPVYGQYLRQAQEKGVTITAFPTILTDDGIELTAQALPLKL